MNGMQKNDPVSWLLLTNCFARWVARFLRPVRRARSSSAKSSSLCVHYQRRSDFGSSDGQRHEERRRGKEGKGEQRRSGSRPDGLRLRRRAAQSRVPDCRSWVARCAEVVGGERRGEGAARGEGGDKRRGQRRWVLGRRTRSGRGVLVESEQAERAVRLDLLAQRLDHGHALLALALQRSKRIALELKQSMEKKQRTVGGSKEDGQSAAQPNSRIQIAPSPPSALQQSPIRRCPR